MSGLFLTLIEGNIGCGKTTLVGVAADKGNGRIVRIDERISTELLELFYADPTRYALLVQLTTLERRTNAVHLRLLETKASLDPLHGFCVALADRSFFGDFVFAVANYVTGSMTDAELAVYFAHAGCDHLCALVDVLDETYAAADSWSLMYLHSPAAECKQRVDQLRRSVEADVVSLAYYELLEQIYFNALRWLRQARPGSVTVLTWTQYRDSQRTASHILYGQAYEPIPDSPPRPSGQTRTADAEPRFADPPGNVDAGRLARLGVQWFARAYVHETMERWAQVE